MRNLVLFLAFSILGCATAPMEDTDNVRVTIERRNADLVRWYAAGDVDSVVSVFAEDAWQMPPNSPPLVGREAIRQYWANAMKIGAWGFALQTQGVSVCGPIAVERGKYVLTFTAGPGAPPGMGSFQDHGNYLVHWRHDADGQWRVVGDAPVSEVPPPSSAPHK